jgi:flavin reductase (DIM6/NTAB) family NADH-FMN oxidoreductase RutF
MQKETEYSDAIKTKYPEQVVIAIAKDKNGKANPITLGGRDTDKFAEFDCKTEHAKAIDSLLLSDAVANFECTLESQMPAGDHIIFVGEVVSSHINTESKKRLYTTGPGHKLGSVS